MLKRREDAPGEHDEAVAPEPEELASFLTETVMALRTELEELRASTVQELDSVRVALADMDRRLTAVGLGREKAAKPMGPKRAAREAARRAAREGGAPADEATGDE
jgi:hypothetical protein